MFTLVTKINHFKLIIFQFFEMKTYKLYKYLIKYFNLKIMFENI